MTAPPPRHKSPWPVLFGVDLLVTVTTLVIFGAFGGLMLLVALNGFSESTGGAIIIAYIALVLVGNALVTSLLNLLIRRRWFAAVGLSRLAACVPAVVVTLVLLLAGPPLAVVLIKLIF